MLAADESNWDMTFMTASPGPDSPFAASAPSPSARNGSNKLEHETAEGRNGMPSTSPLGDAFHAHPRPSSTLPASPTSSSSEVAMPLSPSHWRQEQDELQWYERPSLVRSSSRSSSIHEALVSSGDSYAHRSPRSRTSSTSSRSSLGDRPLYEGYDRQNRRVSFGSSPGAPRASVTTPIPHRAGRRVSSPLNLDASMLDMSFAPAEIGDKTYDDLEVAVETNTRRRSMGFALRTALPPSPEELTRQPRQVEAPTPSRQRGSPPHRTPLLRVSPTRELRERHDMPPPPLPSTSSLQLPQQPQRTRSLHSPMRRSPLRARADTLEQDVAVLDTTALLGTDALQNSLLGSGPALLDSGSFRLTPPKSRPIVQGLFRDPAPRLNFEEENEQEFLTTQTPARTPASAPARTPARTLVHPPRTPASADMTMDIKQLLQRTTRPKRPSGTEESFLAGRDIELDDLADLTEDTILVPPSLRPNRHVPPSPIPSRSDTLESASLRILDERGLPAALPRSESTRLLPRSETITGITRSDSTRTITRSKDINSLPESAPQWTAPVANTMPRSDSSHGLATARPATRTLPASSSRRSLLPPSASSRSLATPVRPPRDRADVPLTMRKRAPASTPAVSTVFPAPSGEDRWADAIERDPVAVARHHDIQQTQPRGLTPSRSTRRMSTLPSRRAEPTPARTSAPPRSTATARESLAAARPIASSDSQSTGLSRTTSTRAIADRPSAEPRGLARATSTRSVATAGEPRGITRSNSIRSITDQALRAPRTSMVPSREPEPARGLTRTTSMRSTVAQGMTRTSSQRSIEGMTRTSSQRAIADRRQSAVPPATTTATRAPRPSTTAASAPRSGMTRTSSRPSLAPRRAPSTEAPPMPTSRPAVPQRASMPPAPPIRSRPPVAARTRPLSHAPVRSEPLSDTAAANAPARRSAAPGAGVALAKTKLSAEPRVSSRPAPVVKRTSLAPSARYI